jgi:hypothetical protein
MQFYLVCRKIVKDLVVTIALVLAIILSIGSNQHAATSSSEPY